VHNWANLQSVHMFRCYDNIHVCKLITLYSANAYSAERKMSASACTRSVPGLCYFHTFTDLSVQLCQIEFYILVFIAWRSVTEKNGRWHVADATADCWLATHAQVGRLHQMPGLFLAVFKLQ